MQCNHKRLVGEESFTSLWRNHRVFLLGGEIDADGASLAIAKMLYLELESAEQPMHLYIDSPGGFVTSRANA
jgi:ATP-dependent Clp protease protease subunit